MCAYPISDIYAPTPRYLYYCLLFMTFATLRHRWLSHTFLGAAVAYAASAAIHAIIIASRPAKVAKPAAVAVPFIAPTSNLTKTVSALVTNTSSVIVQPDAVELDIDPIMAVVVTAYLVGLPLQLWSRTMRSSNIARYLLILWNMCMLAGTICALVSWPLTNLAAPQYRFCYAGFLDPTAQNSAGWDASYWRGTWNDTLGDIFNPQNSTTWLGLSNSCFYPCFNTSQTIRLSSSLRAVVTDGSTKFAKLHVPTRSTNDAFRSLIYAAIVFFTAAQFFLLLVSASRLCSDTVRETIHEPRQIWLSKKRIWRQLARDAQCSWRAITSKKEPERSASTENIHPGEVETNKESSEIQGYSSPPRGLLVIPRLIVDSLALLTLMAGFCLSGPLVVAFICWIEWYIRNDGSTNETIKQVGQWAPLVSLAVVLFATIVHHLLNDRLSSAEEVRREIEETEAHLAKLRGRLAQSRDDASREIEMRSLG